MEDLYNYADTEQTEGFFGKLLHTIKKGRGEMHIDIWLRWERNRAFFAVRSPLQLHCADELLYAKREKHGDEPVQNALLMRCRIGRDVPRWDHGGRCSHLLVPAAPSELWAVCKHLYNEMYFR